MRPWRPGPNSKPNPKPALAVLIEPFGRPGVEHLAVLAEIQHGPSKLIRITLERFGPRLLVCARLWVKNPDQREPVPTTKGVYFKRSEFPILRRALDAAERLMSTEAPDAAP